MNRLLSQILGVEQEKVTDCLGLYISPTDMFLAQTVKKDNGLKIEGLIRVPVPPLDKTTLKPLDLNEAFFLKPENWLEPLNNAIAKKKWRTKRIIVSLSPSFSILRYFVMPAVERKFWKQSVPLQARKYIHYSFEKSIYSYYAYPFETPVSKQKKLGVIFGLTSAGIKDMILSGLKSIGFDVLAVEVSAFSAARAYASLDKESVPGKGRIYSFFGADSADFLFLSNNIPVLARELDISGPLPIERRRLEMANYIDFISKQTEKDSFEEVVAAGQNTEQWTPVLEADARKPVRYLNLKESLGFDSRNIGEISAIGACSKFVDEKLPNVDLSGRNRISNTEISALLTAWKVAAAAVLLMVGLNITNRIEGMRISAELRKEKSSAIKIDDFAGMSSEKVVSMSEDISKKRKEYDGMVDVKAVTPLLVSLAKITPREIWVAKYSYKELYGAKSGFEKPFLEIEGYINSPRGDWKSDLDLGNKYKDAVAGDAVLGALCKSINAKGPEITFPVETSNSAFNPAENIKKGTRFLLKCAKDQGGKK